MASSLAKSVVDSFAKVVAGIFVFCQGAAAGLAITVFVLAYVVAEGEDVGFLRVFSPLARTIQGLFFFFVTMAFLGAIDKYAKDKMGSWYTSWSRQGIDILVIGLYAFALFFTSLASSTADIMFYAHERIPGWYEAPGAISSSFADDLDTWHAFNLLRIWAVIIAWVLLSLETHTYRINDSNYHLYMASIGGEQVVAGVSPTPTSS